MILKHQTVLYTPRCNVGVNNSIVSPLVCDAWFKKNMYIKKKINKKRFKLRLNRHAHFFFLV